VNHGGKPELLKKKPGRLEGGILAHKKKKAKRRLRRKVQRLTARMRYSEESSRGELLIPAASRRGKHGIFTSYEEKRRGDEYRPSIGAIKGGGGLLGGKRGTKKKGNQLGARKSGSPYRKIKRDGATTQESCGNVTLEEKTISSEKKNRRRRWTKELPMPHQGLQKNI